MSLVFRPMEAMLTHSNKHCSSSSRPAVSPSVPAHRGAAPTRSNKLRPPPLWAKSWLAIRAIHRTHTCDPRHLNLLTGVQLVARSRRACRFLCRCTRCCYSGSSVGRASLRLMLTRYNGRHIIARRRSVGREEEYARMCRIAVIAIPLAVTTGPDRTASWRHCDSNRWPCRRLSRSVAPRRPAFPGIEHRLVSDLERHGGVE